MPAADDLIPVPLPHFRLRDDGLHFVISRRPFAALGPRERELWQALDGRTDVGALRRRFPEAADLLGRFRELGLCELVPARFPAARRRVLVLEPHMDDGVLSVGGTMWSRHLECEFAILTLAGRSNFTSYYYLDRDFFAADEITALRRAESELLARRLGGSHAALAEREAPLRYRDGDWTAEWFARHRYSVSAFIAHRSSDTEQAAWAAALREALRGAPADEIWLPLGVGPHTDHELTRNAWLAAWIAEPALFAGRTVRLYQEAPYAAQFPRYTEALLAGLGAAGMRLVPEPEPVDESFAEKLRLVSLFGSQFKLETQRAGLEASARAAAGGRGLAELFFRVEAPPRALDPLALNVHAEEVGALAPAVAHWLGRHRGARRLRVLLRAPAGRWRQDMEALLAAFPAARIKAYVTAAGAAEAVEFRSPRVAVRPVTGGAAAWVRCALRVALARPAPTLIVSGPRRERQARLLSRLFPLSDTVIAPTLHVFYEALRLARAGERRPD